MPKQMDSHDSNPLQQICTGKMTTTFPPLLKLVRTVCTKDVPDSNFPNPAGAGAGFAKNQHQR